MRKLRFVAHFALAITSAFACAQTVQADRIIFSEVGFPVLSDPGDPDSPTVAPAALSFTTVPTITMNVGDTKTLHIWMEMVAPNHTYNSVAWSIDSSLGNIVRAVNNTVSNPENLAIGSPRWDNGILGTLGPADSTDLLEDAYGFKVTRPGIGFASSGASPLRTDQGRDNATHSFYLGSITVQGSAAGTTGLYFRTGDFKHVLTTGTASIQYGHSAQAHAGNVVDSGDPITANNAEADAIIIVEGPLGGPTVTLTPHADGVLTGDIVFNGSPAGTFLDAGGRTSGRINFNNYVGQNNGALPLFFDLVPGASAAAIAQLVTDLNALPARPFTASATTQFGSDILLTFPNQPAGADLFVDFDFGAALGVARVGIPEPSTFTLAAISLVGLFGVRRRRLAKA